MKPSDYYKMPVEKRWKFQKPRVKEALIKYKGDIDLLTLLSELRDLLDEMEKGLVSMEQAQFFDR